MKILTYPNRILTQVCKPINNYDSDLATFCDEMYELMLEHDGVGLSAVQVGVLKRIIVIDVIGRRVIINPEIRETTTKPFKFSEGCLSVPNYFEDRERPESILLRYETPYKEVIVTWISGLEAFCIQHEMDHLEGKLFIDDLSPLKKDRVRKKIEKMLRRK